MVRKHARTFRHFVQACVQGAILKKFGQCRPLQQYHYIVSDAEKVGNLTHGVVACRLGDERASLLLCKECGQGAEEVQQIVLHGDVGEEFLHQRREKYCIHAGCRTIQS